MEVVRLHYAGSRESLKTSGGGRGTLIGVVLQQVNSRGTENELESE